MPTTTTKTKTQIRNLGAGGRTCLDSPARKKDLKKPVGLYPCHNQGGNQVCNKMKKKKLKRPPPAPLKFIFFYYCITYNKEKQKTNHKTVIFIFQYQVMGT